ncbi:hypothetical protein CANARDRAFT_7938 [[Candida] arabinofermentans NRRL YB-2248]|uniref:Uncharacterized protein n=1 Tax=[Candida] arabinofermentans NRRL YB-2248 TaxID=983967 RepID=A0A1E4T0M6_9ASCO|nr:hypothetical protein CANARDRAFT_7938 [[Candida] arabinofermentans NRRL YB-2248]
MSSFSEITKRLPAEVQNEIFYDVLYRSLEVEHLSLFEDCISRLTHKDFEICIANPFIIFDSPLLKGRSSFLLKDFYQVEDFQLLAKSLSFMSVGEIRVFTSEMGRAHFSALEPFFMKSNNPHFLYACLKAYDDRNFFGLSYDILSCIKQITVSCHGVRSIEKFGELINKLPNLEKVVASAEDSKDVDKLLVLKGIERQLQYLKIDVTGEQLELRKFEDLAFSLSTPHLELDLTRCAFISSKVLEEVLALLQVSNVSKLLVHGDDDVRFLRDLKSLRHMRLLYTKNMDLILDFKYLHSLYLEYTGDLNVNINGLDELQLLTLNESSIDFDLLRKLPDRLRELSIWECSYTDTTIRNSTIEFPESLQVFDATRYRSASQKFNLFDNLSLKRNINLVELHIIGELCPNKFLTNLPDSIEELWLDLLPNSSTVIKLPRNLKRFRFRTSFHRERDKPIYNLYVNSTPDDVVDPEQLLDLKRHSDWLALLSMPCALDEFVLELRFNLIVKKYCGSFDDMPALANADQIIELDRGTKRQKI